MKIRLLAFATAADAVGARESEIEVAEGATIGDLKTQLLAAHSDLEPLWSRLAVAIDGAIAAESDSIPEGSEVALLPPVSGGAPRCEIVDEAIDVRAVIARVAGEDCGAILVFTGTARDNHEGRPVAKLAYDAYRPMALQALERITAELEAEHEGLRIAITHRLGDVVPGEPSIVIAAASPHRAASFDGTREALERLKREVPVWKREHYGDGEAQWREEEPLVSVS